MFVTRPEHQKDCAQFYIAKLYGVVIVFKRSVNPMWITIISHKLPTQVEAILRSIIVRRNSIVNEKYEMGILSLTCIIHTNEERSTLPQG
jgi:hypothetical protein